MRACVGVALVAVALGLAAEPAAAPGAWRAAAPMPVARSEIGAARLGNGIVVVGGYLPGGSANTARVDLYTPATNRWRRLADLPLKIDHTAVASYRGRLYVAGGFDRQGREVHRAFVLVGGRWRELPRMPARRAASAAAILGGKLYLVGGFTGIGERIAGDALVLDLRTNRWSTAPGPSPRDHLGATVVGGRIYAVAGERGGPGHESKLLESWAPRERRWTRLPDIPRARSGIGVAPVRNGFVVAGGGGTRGAFGDVHRFDVATRRWTALPELRTPRHSLGLVAFGSRLYAVGGGQFGLSVSPVNEYLVVP